MDKDVQVRLAALEEKVDRLIRRMHISMPMEVELRFSDQFDPERESRRVICTTPPVRGD